MTKQSKSERYNNYIQKKRNFFRKRSREKKGTKKVNHQLRIINISQRQLNDVESLNRRNN